MTRGYDDLKLFVDRVDDVLEQWSLGQMLSAVLTQRPLRRLIVISSADGPLRDSEVKMKVKQLKQLKQLMMMMVMVILLNLLYLQSIQHRLNILRSPKWHLKPVLNSLRSLSSRA